MIVAFHMNKDTWEVDWEDTGYKVTDTRTN